MRSLIFFSSTLVGFILLSVWKVRPEAMELLWSGASSIILGIVSLFFVGRKRGEQFMNFRKPKVRDFLGVFAVLVALFLVLIGSAVYVPEKIGGFSFSSGGDELLGDSYEDNDSVESREGTSEGAEIDIPKKGLIDSPKLAELWIQPIDQATAEAMRDKRFYVYQKSGYIFDGVSAWTKGQEDYGKVLKSEDGWTRLAPSRKVENKYTYIVTQKSDFNNIYGISSMEKVKLPWILEELGAYKFKVESEDERWMYEVVSDPVTFKDLIEEEITFGDTDPTYSYNNFDNALRGWARTVAALVRVSGASAPLDQLLVVNEIMDEQFKYSLSVDNMDDLPPMENFLLHEKRGYCVHYATATALVLRELGVPCRVTAGYSAGSYFPQKNTWVFYNHNAHAWVEIFTEKWGWVVYDTTPEEPLIGGDTIEGKDLGSLGQIRFFLLIIFGIMVVLTILGARNSIKLNKRSSRKREEDERSTYQEKEYIAAYRAMCQAKSIPMLSGDTLMDHVKWLDSEGKKPDFADELVQYHYNTTYRMQESHKATEKRFIKQIKGW